MTIKNTKLNGIFSAEEFNLLILFIYNLLYTRLTNNKFYKFT